MTKIIVDVKKIDEVGDDMMIVLYCRKPEQKNRSRPAPGREELERSNAQFQIDAEQHRQDMEEFKKEIHKIHIGRALLIQDQEVEE